MKSTARSARISLVLENQHLSPGLACVLPAHGPGEAVSPQGFSRDKDIQVEQCSGCCCRQRDRGRLVWQGVSPVCSRAVASAWLCHTAGEQAPAGSQLCQKGDCRCTGRGAALPQALAGTRLNLQSHCDIQTKAAPLCAPRPS